MDSFVIYVKRLHVACASPELQIILPQPPECRRHRYAEIKRLQPEDPDLDSFV